MRVYVNYCTIHVRSVHVRACAYSYVMVIAFRGLRPRVYTKKSAAAAAEPHVHLKPAAGRRPTCSSSSCPAATVKYHGSVLNMPTDVKIVSDHSADSRNEISSRELVYTHFIIHIPRRVRFGLRAARGGGGRRRHRRCAPTASAGRA